MRRDLNCEWPPELPTDESELGWTLCFVGDSQQTKLAELVKDLKGDFSKTGDEKKVISGFSYWGISPSISWAKTCSDPFYPVMRQSIQSFRARWQDIYFKHLEDKEFHYVSLGVGTGEKDCHILNDLLPKNPSLFYFPVDMSATMLRMAIQEVLRLETLNRSKILPIQIDFSDNKRVKNLRELIDRIAPDHPILFSLLGNTLANFKDDSEVLKTLSKLMRQNDFLLLELATTKDLENETTQSAALEYARIESFKKFATSALLQNTDIHINLDNLLFQPSVEEQKAILIKVIYQNLAEKAIRVMLPDWSSIDFLKNDSIRLYLTRKYTSAGIDQLILGNNLSIVGKNFSKLYNSNAKFGMDLALVAPHRDQGDYIGMSQDLTQAAVQIQNLLEQLQTNGITIDSAQKQVAEDMKIQAQNNPTMKDKLFKWGLSLGDATVSEVVKGAVKLAIRSVGIPLP
jgi:L-histidine Nalpha-methyltransferase